MEFYFFFFLNKNVMVFVAKTKSHWDFIRDNNVCIFIQNHVASAKKWMGLCSFKRCFLPQNRGKEKKITPAKEKGEQNEKRKEKKNILKFPQAIDIELCEKEKQIYWETLPRIEVQFQFFNSLDFLNLYISLSHIEHRDFLDRKNAEHIFVFESCFYFVLVFKSIPIFLVDILLRIFHTLFHKMGLLYSWIKQVNFVFCCCCCCCFVLLMGEKKRGC